mgnify:CR=1 FL=1
MEELWAYRERLLGRHTEQVAAFRSVLGAFPARRLSDPAPAGGWSAHQLAVHVRDVEIQAYIPRVHRLLAEANPLLADFDAEAFMAEHYDPGEPVSRIAEDVDRARHALRLELPFDRAQAWSRTGRHPALGVRSVQTWVERAVAHFDEHLLQLEARLRAAR